jgi:hypothetical protein
MQHSTYRSEVPWRCLAGIAVTVREARMASEGDGCGAESYHLCHLQTTCPLNGVCSWLKFSFHVKQREERLRFICKMKINITTNWNRRPAFIFNCNFRQKGLKMLFVAIVIKWVHSLRHHLCFCSRSNLYDFTVIRIRLQENPVINI